MNTMNNSAIANNSIMVSIPTADELSRGYTVVSGITNGAPHIKYPLTYSRGRKAYKGLVWLENGDIIITFSRQANKNQLINAYCVYNGKAEYKINDSTNLKALNSFLQDYQSK